MKIIGMIFKGIAVFMIALALAVITLGAVGGYIMNQKVSVKISTIDYSIDDASIARGKYLVQAVTACEGCHGEGLKGSAIIDEPPFGRYVAPDLRGNKYTIEDFERAMRHGVKVDGRKFLIMPSYEYAHIDDNDIGAIYAYAKSLPESKDDIEGTNITFIFKVMAIAGAFGPFPYDKIDHSKKVAVAPNRSVSANYGRYIAQGCRGCHGSTLKGGPIPGGEPGSPPASDISNTGPIASWSLEDFKIAMREGIGPKGKKIDPNYMPWREFGKMTDGDLEALWLYLTSSQNK